MRILLIEDHKMVALSLKVLLEIRENFKVDILNNFEDLEDKNYILNYDLFLIDINLSGIRDSLNGLDLSEHLIRMYPLIKIIILTSNKLEYYLYRAEKIGCHGFISKHEEITALIKLIKDVDNKNCILLKESSDELVYLTKRELSIIRLYSSGLTRKEIADKLHINVRSLAVSISSIYEKLSVNNYQEMVRKSIKLGYVDLF